jgi:hypothetical protein
MDWFFKQSKILRIQGTLVQNITQYNRRILQKGTSNEERQEMEKTIPPNNRKEMDLIS